MSAGSSIPDFMADWPPALQLFGVAVLGLYTVVSWAGRLSPRLHWLWSHPNAHTRGHFIDYTVIPTVVFVAAAWMILPDWDPTLPLYGSWEPSRVWKAIGAFSGGTGSLVTAHHLAKTRDISDARRLASWLPLLLGAIGFGLLFTCARLT